MVHIPTLASQNPVYDRLRFEPQALVIDQTPNKRKGRTAPLKCEYKTKKSGPAHATVGFLRTTPALQ